MVGWRRALGTAVIASMAIACGAGKPAASADTAEEHSEGADTASEAAERGGEPAAVGDESPATDDSRGADAAPAAAEDVQAVLQLVVDDEALQPFLHLEEPGRFPLRIAFGANVNMVSGVELSKLSKPVEVVDSSAASDPKQPAILITEVTIEGDRARVAYRYKVEGLHGSATLAKTKQGRWELVNSMVTER